MDIKKLKRENLKDKEDIFFTLGLDPTSETNALVDSIHDLFIDKQIHLLNGLVAICDHNIYLCSSEERKHFPVEYRQGVRTSNETRKQTYLDKISEFNVRKELK